MDSSNIKHRDSSSAESSVILEDEKLSSSSMQASQESLRTQEIVKARAEKAEAVRQACDADDVEALVSYATSEGGLIEDELRQRVCK